MRNYMAIGNINFKPLIEHRNLQQTALISEYNIQFNSLCTQGNRYEGWRKHTNAGVETQDKGVIDESSFLPFKIAAFGTKNFKPMPDLREKADYDSKQPKSVSTFDYNSKNPNHVHPVPTKSQQGTKLQDGIAENRKPPEDTIYSSITRFNICSKNVNTGGLKRKTSLLVRNREKRNQMKRAAEGPNINILRPGMVLMKGYMSLDDQVKIVKTCRELGTGDGGFYQPGYENGAKLHFKMMCLDLNWDPESRQYSYIRVTDNSKPPKIPDYFQDMDKDERIESLDRGLPVVSFSIGDTAAFLYGNERDIEKAEKVNLESGDVLLFGGESRNIFHVVSSIVPDTASRRLLEATDMCPGRLNLTFRRY
ncbi:hypothetical protein L2E82_28108 [Cichorium intybus]|uniref:Uncharacterized protein n=1 Tax=Cichorium intybus TaxID=13427 RepID=A0ACB9CUY5_CICIN|nr:hypothetical protein L2E82_28108 [Cichorium intybus]